MKRRVLSICILICMLCMSVAQGVVFAAAPTGFVFSEDFSSGTIGTMVSASTAQYLSYESAGNVAGINKYAKFSGTWSSLNAELKRSTGATYDRSIQVGSSNAFSTEGANTTVYIDMDILLNNAEYDTGTNFALYIGARANGEWSGVGSASEVMALWFDPSTKHIKKSKGTSPFNLNNASSNFEDFATPISYVPNHWYRLRIVAKVTDDVGAVRTYDMYLDGEKVASDLAFANDLADQLLTSITLVRGAAYSGAANNNNHVGLSNVSVYVDKGAGALTNTGALLKAIRAAQATAVAVAEEDPIAHSLLANRELKNEIDNAITLYNSVKAATTTGAIETNIVNEIAALNTAVTTVENSTVDTTPLPPVYGGKKDFEDGICRTVDWSVLGNVSPNRIVSSEYDMYLDGVRAPVAAISNAYNHTEGGSKSLKINNSYKSASDVQGYYPGRTKFFNLLKDSALTEDDLGKTFKVSFWVYFPDPTNAKSDAIRTIQTGLIALQKDSCGAGVCYKPQNVVIEPNTWQEVCFTVTLDENNIAATEDDPINDANAATAKYHQVGMLGIITSSMNTDAANDEAYKCEFYVDDISIQEVAQVGTTITGDFSVGSSLGADVTFIPETDGNVRAIMAVYSADGKLKTTAIGGNVVVKAGINTTASAEIIELPPLDDGDYYKVFVWGDGFAPFVAPYTD